MRGGKDDCWIRSIVVERSSGEMRITAEIGLFDKKLKIHTLPNVLKTYDSK